MVALGIADAWQKPKTSHASFTSAW